MARRIIILESQVREAMKYTKSNIQAARYCKVSYPTYKKWAKQYIDSETNKSLFEMHLNEFGRGIPKYASRGKKNGGKVWSLEEIFSGSAGRYSLRKLHHRMATAGLLEDKCQQCGYEERRISDGTAPLILGQIDGNPLNYERTNLELVCYNCYYNQYGNLWGRHKYQKNANAIDDMRKKDMIEGVEVDEDGLPTNLDTINQVQLNEGEIDIKDTEISNEDIKKFIQENYGKSE
jgi:hypothetical protein